LLKAINGLYTGSGILFPYICDVDCYRLIRCLCIILGLGDDDLENITVLAKIVLTTKPLYKFVTGNLGP